VRLSVVRRLLILLPLALAFTRLVRLVPLPFPFCFFCARVRMADRERLRGSPR
jgi:hypothetical protein